MVGVHPLVYHLPNADTDGDELIDGFFGGVLRFLEALWDFLVSLASMIADAVMAAISFIIDFILGLVAAAVEALLQPLIDAVESWAYSMVTILGDSYSEYCDSGRVSQSSVNDVSEIIFGPTFLAFVGLTTAVAILGYILLPFMLMFGFLIGALVALITGVILNLLMTSPDNRDDEPEKPNTESTLSMINSAIDIADPPEEPTPWDWLRTLLPQVTAIVGLATASSVVAASIGSGMSLMIMFGIIVLDSFKTWDWGKDYLKASYSFLAVVALMGIVLNLAGGIAAATSSNWLLWGLTVIGEAFALYAFWDSQRQLELLEES